MKSTALKRAFTLMEIMITVAIIAILAAIGVYIGNQVRNRAKVTSTQSTLKVLSLSMSEFIQYNPEPVEVGAQLWLQKLTVSPKTGPQILSQSWYATNSADPRYNPGHLALPADLISNPVMSPQALDAWGNPIFYLPSKNAGVWNTNNLPTLPGAGGPQAWQPPGGFAKTLGPNQFQGLKDAGYFWSYGPDGLPAGFVIPGVNTPADDVYSDPVNLSAN